MRVRRPKGKETMTRLLALAMLLLLAAGVAQAAPYPERPIRLVVPFAPGGSTDVVARLLAQELSIQLGQSVVVDNRAGGGTNIGVDFVARAAPDGYVLLMASTTQAINVSLYRRLSYDLIKDFTPISPVATSPSMLVVHPSVPATSLATLLAFARDKPGALTYA